MIRRLARTFIRSAIPISLALVSCRTHTKTAVKSTETVTLPAGQELIPAADSIIKTIRSADIQFKWFTARLNANADIDSKANSFNANLRIKRDSVIWMSISPALGIEVARVFITPDSLKFINRINNTYFKGDYRYLNSLLQIESNFQMIQAILLGNSYLHYKDEKYFSEVEYGDWVISTLNKRKIKRETELEIPQIVTQEIWYSLLRKKIFRMEMQDFRPQRKFSVEYKSFIEVEGQMAPTELSIIANAAKNLRISLQYSKTSIDKEVNLPFSIPENYEKIR
jgi:hypothetical protein